jgi:hypothetical protein
MVGLSHAGDLNPTLTLVRITLKTLGGKPKLAED